MRILIDGFYVDKPRGHGRYIRELLHALGAHARRGFDVVVAVPKGAQFGARLGAQLGDGISLVPCPTMPFPVWEQAFLPFLCTRFKPDVLHCGYNTAPLLPPNGARRVVVTLHDLMFRYGDVTTLYQRIGRSYRNFVFDKLPLKRYDVVCVSKATAAELYDAKGKASKVVYTAVDEFSELTPRLGARQDRGAYFLHIGGTAPHKNTERTISAFLRHAPATHRLVVLGVPASSGLARKNASDRVVFPGWLSDQEVAAYYERASAVVFPSLMEGYGLPIVEAFRYGVPVITSNRNPMAELAAGAAILVDPTSEDDIGNAFVEVEKDGVRSTLIEQSAQRLGEFSSAKMADDMFRIYGGA